MIFNPFELMGLVSLAAIVYWVIKEMVHYHKYSVIGSELCGYWFYCEIAEVLLYVFAMLELLVWFLFISNYFNPIQSMFLTVLPVLLIWVLKVQSEGTIHIAPINSLAYQTSDAFNPGLHRHSVELCFGEKTAQTFTVLYDKL